MKKGTGKIIVGGLFILFGVTTLPVGLAIFYFLIGFGLISWGVSHKKSPPKAISTALREHPEFGKEAIKAVENDAPSTLYGKAKDLAQCLFDFPYKDPSFVPPSVRQDKALMEIITAAHRTTIGSDGKTQQTTIDAAERIKLQAEFKIRIYALLDKCLMEDPEHALALLLYPKVADWNTRAADRKIIIELYERLLPAVEKVKKGTRAYGLVERDIEGMGGNYFDKVERHLSDFHYELGQLYMKVDRFPDAITQLERAETLMPPIYAGTVGKAYAEVGEYEKALEHMKRALKVRMEKFRKDLGSSPK